MNIKYDKTVDALYMDLAVGRYHISKKITDTIVVDMTKTGKVLGIEILDATKNIRHFDPSRIVRSLQIQDGNQSSRPHQ